MRLTPHFTLSEFTDSATAKALKIDNTPDEQQTDNLKRLANLLEEIRGLYDRPVVINSGFRCPELNQAVGGVSNSQHLSGCAADIFVPGVSIEALYTAIIANQIQFDQCINEFGRWIHLSISDNPRRHYFRKMK